MKLYIEEDDVDLALWRDAPCLVAELKRGRWRELRFKLNNECDCAYCPMHHVVHKQLGAVNPVSLWQHMVNLRRYTDLEAWK